ncbi:hypothetical protein [Aeromonas hydrophila]|uniref:hypothetical protein n=1 Tax=Aeromonas hydrophila TaxID=644 RepID=UPI001F61A50E|nr:hypothetical protein [Aeromonas hydrophila]UNU29672.1 hypothetical protein GCK65_11400 [Aeromonas hydrophila]
MAINLKIKMTETAMKWNGSGFGEEILSQNVFILENSGLSDPQTKLYRDETKQYRDETKQYRDEITAGRLLSDQLVLASGKAYEVKLKAVPTGFELWL